MACDGGCSFSKTADRLWRQNSSLLEITGGLRWEIQTLKDRIEDLESEKRSLKEANRELRDSILGRKEFIR